MNFKNTPIRRKLMGAILLTCSVVLLLMFSAYAMFEYYSYRNMVKTNVTTLGLIIASNSSGALAFDSQADADDILNALNANKHIVAACLYDKRGRLFATYPANAPVASFAAKAQNDGHYFDASSFTVLLPVVQKNDRLGTLYIKSDLDEMYTQLRHFLLIAIALVAGLLVVAYLLSNLFQKTISEPILSLEQTARKVSSAHDYAVRAIKTGNDELGALTDTFNQMLEQIERQNIEIKKAEEASSKLAAIVESSDDAIISKTLDGTITSWNDSAARMYGYSAEEIIGQSIYVVIPEDRWMEEPQILTRLKNGERVEQFETIRISKSGKLFDVSLTVSPIYNSAGAIIGLSKIARDITEKKQEERRKNDFIAMVSHELKTPLTSMRSYIQVLLAIAKKDNNEFRVKALSRAEVQAKKMTNMIQDFLNLARLEEGKIQLTREVFELDPLLREIADDAQFLTTGHIINVDGCEGARVNADRDKIGQVLINLLSNAIKYSPKGGKINITCSAQKQTVKISVTDEGVGIPLGEQKKLFNRFYRVKNESIKTVSGFGIGLYLVSEILRLHNSKIEVESIENEGATFYFSLELR